MTEKWELKDEELRHVVCRCNVADHSLDELHSDKMCKECYQHSLEVAAAEHQAHIKAGWKSPDDCANCLKVDGTTKQEIQEEVAQAISEARKAVTESIVFGQKMAKVLLDSNSSNTFFFIREAYGDIEWHEAKHILEKVVAESREVKP